MARFTHTVKNFPWKGCGPGHVTLSKKFKLPFNISGMNEASLFKFGKWIDYAKSHCRGEKFPMKGRGLGHVTFKNF